ncbi:YopX family protein [Enterococcus casseliflavus]|uniref:YopX family protein n=1 Tax=Enterococcus casseliflavus TaxID=37734 RepID=UPI002DC04662|nr:YopX family protein [Enterococcus casseliflavus]MEB6088047.1 YopX family protein [Enterococcus casseliflavus]
MVPKFRAFLTETKTIHDVLQIDLSRSMVSLKIENASEWYWFKEVVLMQSTGLKDMNGVEVFQGDIVRCSRGCPHEVFWLKEYAGMYVGGMPAWYLSGLSEGYAWTGEEEIIGNIHENPELLEQANES